MDQKEKLFTDLRSCACEKRLPNTYPFVFKMEQQKVMLITLVPSFQAVYRQLASIRFFRQIFLALCGPSPQIRENSLVQGFLNSFYWTHYHKCYLPRVRDNSLPDIDRITPDCYKKHLNREIELLKPCLIIVLGKELVKILFNDNIGEGDCIGKTLGDISDRIESQGKMTFDTQVICANFPWGTEKEFMVLRKIIKRYIGWIDTEPVTMDMLTAVDNTKKTLSVHAQFEYEGLYRYWEKIGCFKETSIKEYGNVDDLWIDYEVVPRWDHYAVIISCCSFIEDQLRALLAGNQELANR